MLSGISVHVVKMRMLATTLLLCTLVLMHDVSSQGYFGKIWNKVFKWSFYPVRAARFTIFARYGVPANAYWLHMDWALGAWWNAAFNRYTRYRVFFRIQMKAQPWLWYRCKGWVGFPKFGPPFLVGGIFQNRCWPI